MYNRNVRVVLDGVQDTVPKLTYLPMGRKGYELTDHLGNVLVTVSDRKLGVGVTVGQPVSYWRPDISMSSDYYPFGMPMFGRTKFLNQYRYGFNGKENDNDVKGNGNQQDYGMRFYDPRIGKFLSIDPLTKDYPWYTPYQFAGNDVIRNTDVDGAEPNPYYFLPQWQKNIDQTLQVISGTIKGLEQLAHDLAPIRPADENDPQSFGEGIDRIKNIPTNIANLPANLKDVFTNGTLEEKTSTVVGIVGLIKSGKIGNGGKAISSPTMLKVVQAGFNPKTRILSFIQGSKERAKPIKVKVPDGFEIDKIGDSKEIVFKQKGKKVWISGDADGHNGGIWKKAEGKAKYLFDENKRTTWNEDLTKQIK